MGVAWLAGRGFVRFVGAPRPWLACGLALAVIACGDSQENAKPEGSGGQGSLGGSSQGGTYSTARGGTGSDADTGGSSVNPAGGGSVSRGGSATSGGMPATGGAGGAMEAPSAGEAGSAQSAGMSGVGGTTQAPCAGVVCEDLNDCTVDELEDGCICVHRTKTDGSACNDGNVCTEGDVCKKGACAGSAVNSSPTVLNTLSSFGHESGLLAISTFVGNDRVVFASGKKLALASVDATEVKLLDTQAMGASVRADNIGAMVWALRPRTFLLPVLNGMIAVVSENWGIDLFGLANDEITPSERYGFTANQKQMVAAAGGGDRIFTCASSQLHSYKLDRTTKEIWAGPSGALPTRHVCQGLALSEDGKRLYAATSKGLDEVDVSNADGSMTFTRTALAEEFVVDVAVSEALVAGYVLRNLTSGGGDLHIMSRTDLEPVTTFPGDFSENGSVPGAFNFIGPDRLLLQRSAGNVCSKQTAEVLQLSATSTRLSELTTAEVCESPYRTPSSQLTVTKGSAIFGSAKLLVHIDEKTNKLIPLRSLQQGSFERVVAMSEQRLAVHGPTSTHVVDVSKPELPKILAGGVATPMDLEWLRFDVSNPSAPTVVTLPQPGYPVMGRSATLLAPDSSGLPESQATVPVSDPKGQWGHAGDSLYQLTPASTASFELRRFGADNIVPSNTAWTPTLSAQLDSGAPTTLDERYRFDFDVDAASGALAIREERDSSGVSVHASVFSSFRRKGDGFERIRSERVDGIFTPGLRSFAGRTAFTTDNTVFLLGETAAQDKQRVLAAGTFRAEGVLALDEARLTLSATFDASAGSVGVVVLRTSDLEEEARYVTAEPVLSVAAFGSHLAFGMKSSLAIARPACSAN